MHKNAYQTWKIVFDCISKHLKIHQSYSATCWKCVQNGLSCLTYYMKHFDDLLILQWKKNTHRPLEKNIVFFTCILHLTTWTPADWEWICMAFIMASTPPAPTIAVQLVGFLNAMDPRAPQPCSATIGCLAWVVMARTISPRPPASTIEVLTSSFPAIALRRVHTCLAMFWKFQKYIFSLIVKLVVFSFK